MSLLNARLWWYILYERDGGMTRLLEHVSENIVTRWFLFLSKSDRTKKAERYKQRKSN